VAGSPIEFKLKGADAMVRRLNKLGRDVPRYAAGALFLESSAIVRDAKESYVPRDQGVLAGTGTADLPRIEGKDIIAEMFFGGPSSPYAVAIHEFPSDLSPRSWRGKAVGEIRSVRGRKPWSLGTGQRGPKYLERPMRAAMRGMVGRIEARVAAQIESSGGGA